MCSIFTKKLHFFLENKQKNLCPWCNENSWELVLDSTTLALAVENHSILSEKDLPIQNISTELEISQNNNRSKLSIVLRCKNCGCELRFDYLYILDKMKQEAQSQ